MATGRRLCGAIMVVGLAACQSPPVAPERVGYLAADDAAVRIGAPQPVQAMRFVRFSSKWQREDYGVFEADGIRAEVVLLAADPGNTVALDFRMGTEDAVRTFRTVARASPAFGPALAVPGWNRQMFYRTFRLAAAGLGCVGFAGGWPTISEDPENRSRNVLFGYVCRAGTTGLSAETAETIVRSVQVDLSTVWGARAATAEAGDGSALATARGTTGLGNPSFPFQLARFYNVGNGRSGFE